jgi:hypothetical protein
MCPRPTGMGASAAFIAAMLAAPALAAESAPAKSDGIVDVGVPAIFAPVIVGSRLQSYAYITVLLTPAAPDKVFAIREKMPFLRDAFLRELNRGTIVKADDPKAVDTAGIKVRLLDQMNAVLPQGTVSALKLEQIVMAPLDAGS